MSELIFESKDGHRVSVDREADLLTIENAGSITIAHFEFSSGKVSLYSPEDIEIRSGGKLKLRGDEGVDIDSGGDIRVVSSEETIIRGKMVRIN